VFRHVSDAFAEDPVRILRLARFAARFPDFRVADSTNALMRRMVEEGEVDALVAERVWQELSRGLMEQTPSRMFAVLRDCGALARILPELDADAQLMQLVDYAAERGVELPVRFAVLMHGLGKEIGDLSKRLRVPIDCRDLAVMTAREQSTISRAPALDAEAIVTLFERSDAFRKPERFAQMLLAIECASPGHETHAPRLLKALDAARAVNAGEIAGRFVENKAGIPAAVHAARVAAVAS
jgi:tRNA nucleotidyltransferase (CCA-adding enzyme)